mmetsp:Transcript_74176/g.239902  ORF Transcript_74176/g.239902 Transcript_74176/m.239902 type:complete len:97 (-) Transcript_74176:1813-2103(-)
MCAWRGGPASGGQHTPRPAPSASPVPQLLEAGAAGGLGVPLGGCLGASGPSKLVRARQPGQAVPSTALGLSEVEAAGGRPGPLDWHQNLPMALSSA